MKSAGRLAVALVSVATSPPMPGYPAYVTAVEQLRPTVPRHNPPAAELMKRMSEPKWGIAPVQDLQARRAADLMTALVSFTDDYPLPPPYSLFCVPSAIAILERIQGETALLVPEQLDIALQCSKSNLLDAVLALHTATRVLARGRDTRLHDSFKMTLSERLHRGTPIAPFHPADSCGGDPLGDSYHFWANVAGGLYASLPSVPTVQRNLVIGMLYSGPFLMRTIREKTFGSKLFYGNHARIDRLGLRVGLSLVKQTQG